MPEPLKNQFGADVPVKIADMISRVYGGFPKKNFLEDVLDGYESLGLTPRGWKIARALGRHLPSDYKEAIKIITASLGPKLVKTEGFGMAPFLYLPHVFFVAEYGLDNFEISMEAQYELTQRFTAEFSLRPFLEKHREATLARLKVWARDPSPHVRRLVSEGTRPRLPWAPRLPQFQKDPRPVLALLEILKDDKEAYVRRSVANNLNDIGKDHPKILTATARRWMKDAGEDRRHLIRHALRSAVKRGDIEALKILGFGKKSDVVLKNPRITPSSVKIGGSVEMTFDVVNGNSPSRILVDYRVHFVKSNGKPSPKVFKLKTLSLRPCEISRMSKGISLIERTTRKHYAGSHKVEALLNGRPIPLGEFRII